MQIVKVIFMLGMMNKELNWIELDWIELNWIEKSELNWIEFNWIEKSEVRLESKTYTYLYCDIHNPLWHCLTQ